MKQIIFSPFIFPIVLSVVIIYFSIAFLLFNGNKKYSIFLEKTLIILIIIAIYGGGGISLLSKIHPEVLYIRNATAPQGATLPGIIMASGSYFIFGLLLYSRLQTTLKDYLFVCFSLIAINPFFCLYSLIVLFSSFLSDTPAYTVRASLIFLATNALFIYIGKQYSFKDLFSILVWVHLELLLMSVFRGNHGGAWTGVFGHKNTFGLTMAIVPILMYLQSVRIPKYKWLFLGLAALAVFCVQKSSSGMGKLLLILLFSLLGFLRFIKRLPPRLAFACMGVFLAIGISLLILISENAEYIIVDKLGKDMTLTGRTYLWSLVVPAINRHPWVGYGYQGFWQPWRGLENPANIIRHPKFGDFIPMHSQNGFLDIALNVGWVGLTLFILSLLTNIYYGVRHLTRSRGPESVLPLVVLTWVVMSNITEVGINAIASSWIFYVLMTARLTMDNALENFRGNPQLQESYNQSRPPLNSSIHGEGG